MAVSPPGTVPWCAIALIQASLKRPLSVPSHTLRVTALSEINLKNNFDEQIRQILPILSDISFSQKCPKIFPKLFFFESFLDFFD